MWPDADDWYETRPYVQLPPERMANNFSAGALRGPGKIVVPPLVRAKKDETEAWVFLHLGRGVCVSAQGHSRLIDSEDGSICIYGGGSGTSGSQGRKRPSSNPGLAHHKQTMCPGCTRSQDSCTAFLIFLLALLFDSPILTMLPGP